MVLTNFRIKSIHFCCSKKRKNISKKLKENRISGCDNFYVVMLVCQSSRDIGAKYHFLFSEIN